MRSSDIFYGRQAEPIPSSPLLSNHFLVFMQRCCSVPLLGTTSFCLNLKAPATGVICFSKHGDATGHDPLKGVKAPNLQALPIVIILMTSSAQPTGFSWRPTTWTCCLPSSRTRSLAFLFKRSNTYI